MDMELDPLMSPEELARYLNVSYMTIIRWVKSGKIKSRKVGHRLRFKKEDIEELLKVKQN